MASRSGDDSDPALRPIVRLVNESNAERSSTENIPVRRLFAAILESAVEDYLGPNDFVRDLVAQAEIGSIQTSRLIVCVPTTGTSSAS